MFSLKTVFFVLSILFEFSLCSDFYIGMFKRNDYLVAQDRIYKPRIPFSSSQAKYGRIFKCKITYLRVVDRLGIGRGPRVEIIRGGLQNRQVVLRISSVYNYPLSVNVYAGCENKVKATAKTTTTQIPSSADSKQEPAAAVKDEVTKIAVRANGTNTNGTESGKNETIARLRDYE